MTPDLSISIVNTNNREQTLDCLRSVQASTGQLVLEVFVVDNACTDGSAEAITSEFPQVELIRNTAKLGFSTNNNLALGQAEGRYLCLLNDDTLVRPGALDCMIEFMELHPEVGAIGPRLLNADGSIQKSIGFNPDPLYEAFYPLSEWLRPLDWQTHRPIQVEAISGACFMIRREVMEKVGLLDTAFDPLYSEEIDWCFRIRKMGWQIYHLPQAEVVHLGSQTMNRAPLAKMQRLFEKKALFFRKHYDRRIVWTFKLGLAIASLGKSALWAALSLFGYEGAKQKAAFHSQIVWSALRL